MKKISIIASLIIYSVFSFYGLLAQDKYVLPSEKHITQNPFMPMNIVMIPDKIDGITCFSGDVVLAFDGEECVGGRVVEETDKILNLVATSSNNQGKGFRSGQLIRLEYHSNFTGKTFELIPSRIMLGSMNFEELGTLYADFKANALGVDENGELSDIKVYPNPVSHQLHILLSDIQMNSSGTVKVDLISLSGKVVLSDAFPMQQSVINMDMSQLSSGEYTLLLTSENLNFTKKVIKK